MLWLSVCLSHAACSPSVPTQCPRSLCISCCLSVPVQCSISFCILSVCPHTVPCLSCPFLSLALGTPCALHMFPIHWDRLTRPSAALGPAVSECAGKSESRPRAPWGWWHKAVLQGHFRDSGEAACLSLCNPDLCFACGFLTALQQGYGGAQGSCCCPVYLVVAAGQRSCCTAGDGGTWKWQS